MNAIEIKNLSKSFRGMYAVENLNMSVPVGSIYGFIGENGSGKSTTEKIILGHLVPDGGEIKLFGKDYTDPGVRVRIGALVENAGCFPNSSVWTNLMMQAINLGVPNREEEINRVLKIVRMENNAKMKFKNCSLGMKQRIGVAMALLGNPALLILDEPINGLDADGMRIMREILVDITQNSGCTVLISSHVLGELEKIATHYGIIRQGRMIRQITADEMQAISKVFISLKTKDLTKTMEILSKEYEQVFLENDSIYVYGEGDNENIVKILLEHGQKILEIKTNKVGLEDYYMRLMSEKREN